MLICYKRKMIILLKSFDVLKNDVKKLRQGRSSFKSSYGCKTEVVKNHLNPTWKQAAVTVQQYGKKPPNSSDKLNLKTPRSGEQLIASKNGHQLPVSQIVGQSLRGANVTNGPKASLIGKLLVLEAGRDNGISLASKDNAGPTGVVTTEFTNGQAAVGSPTGSSVVLKNTGSAKLSASNKTSASVLCPCTLVDHKPSLAHRKRSCSDFFTGNGFPSLYLSLIPGYTISIFIF